MRHPPEPWSADPFIGSNAHAAPAAPACTCSDAEPPHANFDLPSSDVAMSDWGDLLAAVKGRLGSLATDTATQGVQAALLDCVTALDQLQQTLTHELGRRQLEIFDARTALAHTRAELVGTRASETHARHLAAHDPLTMLPNRKHLHERLSRALTAVGADRPALAVLFLDLDGFKRINDDHGHDAGDQLLKIIAARLHRAVRADDMVGRLGGDEFGLLLTGVADRAPLRQLAGKLLSAVAAPMRIGKLTLGVRASVGIAICPVDGDNADQLLHNADAAMYVAKRNRNGHAFFSESTHAN